MIQGLRSERLAIGDVAPDMWSHLEVVLAAARVDGVVALETAPAAWRSNMEVGLRWKGA